MVIGLIEWCGDLAEGDPSSEGRFCVLLSEKLSRQRIVCMKLMSFMSVCRLSESVVWHC